MKQDYSVIAVDLDEVIIDTAQSVIDHYNRNYGTKIRLEDYYSDNAPNVLDIWGVKDLETASQRINKFIVTDEFNHPIPPPDAVAAVKRLAKKYKLYIVTGRANLIEKQTRDFLDEHFPGVFEEVIFTNLYVAKQKKHKGDICLEIGANLLIDDHLGHILNAAECGVDGLLFGNFPWGKSTKKLPENVKKVRDWDEVLEFLHA